MIWFRYTCPLPNSQDLLAYCNQHLTIDSEGGKDGEVVSKYKITRKIGDVRTYIISYRAARICTVENIKACIL